ncbi:hypothetical protein B0537_15375 [Desulforamulus ferrireducens]|uniref:Uncharacterized protein n=1 Tax=Desulforamulus ferrireducens TaxID=1833852 RepID=A0A1S6IZW9_9FIRM|nr:hypothetical protein B0537_15375 [Desulforamulus ferrireducens]
MPTPSGGGAATSLGKGGFLLHGQLRGLLRSFQQLFPNTAGYRQPKQNILPLCEKNNKQEVQCF